jgi:hypothetical protein
MFIGVRVAQSFVFFVFKKGQTDGAESQHV